MKKSDNNEKLFRVGRSCAGLGLFACKNITKGSFVIEYTGEPILHAEADRRGGRYLFVLNDKIVLDGKEHKHTARYINHACKPNCEAIIEDDAHIMIYAIKNIAKDEEITYDYGSDYVDDFIKKTGCRCHICR